MKFVVPGTPPSKSNAYKISHKRMYKSQACRDWEKLSAECARKAPGLPYEPLSNKIGIRIQVYFKDARRRDLDGILKAALDSWNGVVYQDDSQVEELQLKKFIDADDPRIEVEIEILGE